MRATSRAASSPACSGSSAPTRQSQMASSERAAARPAGACASPEHLAHGVQPGVDVPLPGLDEAVGVQHEQAALGQPDLGLLERQPAQAQRRPGGQVDELGRAVGIHDGGHRVPGPGQRAAPGHRVVDRVQAGRAEIGGAAVGGLLLLVGQPGDHVVEPGEQFLGLQVDVGQGAHGGAQPAHRGGGVRPRARPRRRRPGRPGCRTAGSRRTSRRPRRHPSARAGSGWPPRPPAGRAGAAGAGCSGG